MKLVRGLFSYLLVSVLALSAAFYLASAFMAEGKAQGPEDAAAAPATPTVSEKPAAVTAPVIPAPIMAPPATPSAAGPEALNLVPGQPVQQTAEMIDNSEFDMTGVRDPFRPYRNFKPADQKGLQTHTQTKTFNFDVSDPLQNLELSAVEVVGIIWDVKEPRALIRIGSGTPYTIKRNTKLGRNNGVVTGIREGEVIVVESFEEDGKIFKQFTSLKMMGAAVKKSATASLPPPLPQ